VGPNGAITRKLAGMSQSEDPKRLSAEHEVTLEDVRALMGASTPHFALQIRTRLRALAAGLPAGHPALLEAEREIARLDTIAFDGEIRGHAAEQGLTPLPSVTAAEVPLAGQH
jgi:hypothetical protein